MANLSNNDQANVLIAVGKMMKANGISFEQVAEPAYHGVLMSFLLEEGLSLANARLVAKDACVQLFNDRIETACAEVC